MNVNMEIGLTSDDHWVGAWEPWLLLDAILGQSKFCSAADGGGLGSLLGLICLKKRRELVESVGASVGVERRKMSRSMTRPAIIK